MTFPSNEQAAIIRTERGLTIKGTRISLYDVMDLLKSQYPPKLIGDKFNLTSEQISSALSYIKANSKEIEAEYQLVLQTREEIKSYWEERNREHFVKIATRPRDHAKESLWAKLEEQKAKHLQLKP